MNKPYKRDGIWLHANGSREQYTGLAIETTRNLYEVLRGESGTIQYYWNCKRVESLPDTKLSRLLLTQFNQ